MVKIGVIGCGAIGPTHCDAIQGVDGAKLVAVCDPIKERAKALGEKYGVKTYSSVKKMLDHVDAVTIAIPSGYHAKVGVACAEAGKHILCEKPIDVSLKAAQKLAEAGRKHKVTLTVVSQHRFAKDIQKLREAAQNDGLGKLVAGDAYIKWFRTQAYYDSGDWRGTWKLDGGGCLMNQGVHYVDMIQWVMGGVKSVQAQVKTATHERIEVEDIAQALVEYKNGATGIIYGSTSVYPGLGERMEVHGRYGTVVVEGDRIKVWQADEEASKQGLYGGGVVKQPTPNLQTHDQPTEAQTGASDPSAIWGEQHRLQFEDWVGAIKDKRDPYITAEMAMEPLKVILAIYKSARNGGKRVEV